MARLFFSTLLLLTAALPLSSTAAPLLEMGASARAVAMGGALLALADDEAAIFYNPAGLATLARPIIAAFYQRVFETLHHGGLGGAVCGIGAQILQFDTGSIEGANDFGNPSGAGARFFSRVGLLGLALGNETISLGARAKFTQDLEAVGFGLDAAARLDLGLLRWGVLVENLLGTNGMKLDLRLGAALAWQLDPHWGLRLALDLWRVLHSPEVHIGAEVEVNGLQMRVGYDGVALASGAGVRWKGLRFDWAYRMHPQLPASTMITIAYLF